MLELLRCSTCLDTSSRPWRGRGAVVVTADATWDNRVCEQSVKCTQDEMHTRLQVHSSTAYQLGPGRVLVEMPTVTSCNSRAPAPDCATRDISVVLGLFLSSNSLSLPPHPHFSSPSPSPALPTYPHVSLSLSPCFWEEVVPRGRAWPRERACGRLSRGSASGRVLLASDTVSTKNSSRRVQRGIR